MLKLRIVANSITLNFKKQAPGTVTLAMKIKYLAYVIAAISATTLTACGGDDDNDSSNNGGGDNGGGGTQTSTPYAFNSKFAGSETESSIAYTGQTTRHLLIADLKTTVGNLAESSDKAQAKLDLMFYMTGEVDSNKFQFSKDGVEFFDTDGTYGSISTKKNLAGKIAGEDKEAHILGDEFFGWEEESSDISTPLELMEHYIDTVAGLATDGTSATADTVNGQANLKVYVDEYGRDYQQLIQKFALGAVGFSQGTADYLSTDFQTSNTQADGKTYTTAEHKWDEAFGYFGAARDYNDYTDLEIRAKSGRDEYAKGYHDTNKDGKIDLRSEIHFGNSVNCAKRDVGSAGNASPTDFTKEAFDAFLAGRKLLNDAAATPGDLSDEQVTTLNGYIKTAAVTWEKCIAATVVHYINDVTGDMDGFVDGKFAVPDASNEAKTFEDLAKHWSEMKGFALGLQFSPYSPFRSGDVADIDVDDLKEALTLMGDAPVLADGTQMGSAFDGGVAKYKTDLRNARDILQKAYGFNAENVEKW